MEAKQRRQTKAEQLRQMQDEQLRQMQGDSAGALQWQSYINSSSNICDDYRDRSCFNYRSVLVWRKLSDPISIEMLRVRSRS